MRGRWWRWLSALMAIVFGLVFGFVAGFGVARAAAPAAPGGPQADQPSLSANQAVSRFQPSSASFLR